MADGPRDESPGQTQDTPPFWPPPPGWESQPRERVPEAVIPLPSLPAAAQPNAPLEVKGHSGTVRFDGRVVVISRKGILARASVGKGEKQIPVAHLTAVQFKPAGP